MQTFDQAAFEEGFKSPFGIMHLDDARKYDLPRFCLLPMQSSVALDTPLFSLEETPIRPRIADHGHLSERCFGAIRPKQVNTS